MQLYRLSIRSIFYSKIWFLVLFVLIALPIVLPNLTNVDWDLTLKQPARAQAAWTLCWIVCYGWGFYLASAEGDRLNGSTMGEYLLGRKVSRLRQMFEIWLACMTYIVPTILVAAVTCIVAALPGSDIEKLMWVNMNLQHALLVFLVIAPLLFLAIAVGTRYGGIVGYLAAFSILMYGMHGTGLLSLMTNEDSLPVLKTIYGFSPHYHLADLTPRFFYKLGELEAKQFLYLIYYFSGIGIVFTSLSSLIFKSRKNN